MNKLSALAKLEKRFKQINSLLCIGLDSEITKLPDRFQKFEFPQFEFNKWIIDQTHAYALAYKPNTAFYEAQGSQGWRELEMTMEYLQENHPNIFTICDAKRGDIGSTNQGYVSAIFEHLGFDAVTLHPFTGAEGLAPFLEREDKMSIILCHTSNEGAKELQELQVQKAPLWQVIAKKVTQDWNKNQNCMLVVGATYPEQLKQVREIVKDMWILVPGIGSQGGDLGSVLENGLTKQKKGLLINASRSIIFAKSPRDEAGKLVESMRKHFE